MKAFCFWHTIWDYCRYDWKLTFVFWSSLDNSVQSSTRQEFWNLMLVMNGELMWWGQRSKILLLWLLVLHEKGKLSAIRNFRVSPGSYILDYFCLFLICYVLQWLSLPTIQDHYTRWSRFNDRRCPGTLPCVALIYRYCYNN